MEVSRVNQGHAVSRFLKIGGCRHEEKRTEIDPVLRPCAVVSGQQLERQQVAHARDGHPKPGQEEHRESPRRAAMVRASARLMFGSASKRPLMISPRMGLPLMRPVAASTADGLAPVLSAPSWKARRAFERHAQMASRRSKGRFRPQR